VPDYDRRGVIYRLCNNWTLSEMGIMMITFLKILLLLALMVLLYADKIWIK
jgi:hypothetical protein